MLSEPETHPIALVVEDNPSNLMLISAVLRRGGYHTETAESAEEALERLRTVRPAVILMDLQLPGKDGLSLTRELKADPSTATIPIIALTANAMKEDRPRALAAGCNGYIVKPINTRTFMTELTAILDGR